MSSRFQYQDLDPKRHEIRLLRLLPRLSPAQDSAASNIYCTVQHVSLDDNPDFMALSYIWGHAWEDKWSPPYIDLDGHRFRISSNLQNAFESIRSETEVVILWVDAICINQANNFEKSWQVQMMRAIYEKARSAIIWLGSSTVDGNPADRSDLATERLDEIGNAAIRIGADRRSRNEIFHYLREIHDNSRSTQEDALRQLLADAIDRKTEKPFSFSTGAIINLLQRPWWTRVWVIQEQAVTRHAVFMCGNRSVEATYFIAALTLFMHYEAFVSSERVINPKQLTYYLSDHFPRVPPESRQERMLAMSSRYRKHLPLLALLHHACLADQGSILQATNKRDMVYALLGLATDAQELGIQPECEKSIEEVYIETAIALLKNGHTSVLSLCLNPQYGLPSWVPDWSCAKRYPLQIPTAMFDIDTRYYSAAGTSEPRMSIGEDEECRPVLSISGVFVDTVASVLPTWDDCYTDFGTVYLNLGEATTSYLMKMLRALDTKVSTPYTISASLSSEDIVARTAIADQRLIENGTRTRETSVYRPAYRQLMGVPKTSPYQQHNVTQSDIDIFIQVVSYQANRRRPFITTKGYLGLGPAKILNTHTSAVESYGSRKLVGEAYVHSIMDGEVLNDPHVVQKFDLS